MQPMKTTSMKIELRKVLRQEVKETIQNRAQSIVAEMIIPRPLDDIADWTGELMGKLVTLDAGEDPDVESEVFNQIYDGLIQETMEQLKATKAPKRKKLSK